MAECTVIVNPRDKFSTTDGMLRDLLANTDASVPIVAIFGGATAELQQQWQREFGHRVRFEFVPELLSQAAARNRVMRELDTELVAVIDNDCHVRPGWLDALLERQRATGAAMVVPTVLETERTIHCAGNELFVNYEGDHPYGHKVLSYWGMSFGDGCNLQPRQIAYGELHCQLVIREKALRLHVFDERIIEVGEVDCGMTWTAAGLECWFEPTSVVFFDLFHPVEVCDVELFRWRWDMSSVAEGYRVFEEKWGLDITEEGRFRDFLEQYNAKLPLLPRWLGTAWSMEMSHQLTRARSLPPAGLRAAKRRLRVRSYHGDSGWRSPESFAAEASGGTRRPFTRAWSPPATAPGVVAAAAGAPTQHGAPSSGTGTQGELVS